MDLIPVYEEMGKKLVVMHSFEKNLVKSNKYSYPTIPRILNRTITSAEEPRGSASTSKFSEDVAPQSPLQDLIRFVNTSALGSDSGVQLEPHEAEYNRLLRGAPEAYSCFREQNPTYQLITSILDPDDGLYLAQLMMWRTYLWGWDINFQREFQSVKSGAQFHRKWMKVQGKEGTEALRVTAYGPQYYQNVPFDVDSMTKIWKGALKLWGEWRKWRKHVPLTFGDAERSLNSAELPVYTCSLLSRILLYGDLVRMEILVPPTEKEMAQVIVRANSAASTGVALLGWDRNVASIETALSLIRDTLNSELPQYVRALFHGGEVGIFDVEHILCKIAKKQATHGTASQGWATIRKGKFALKQKRHREGHAASMQREQKQHKVSKIRGSR